MQHSSIKQYLAHISNTAPVGPVAIILAEDDVEVTSTLLHHMSLGFKTILLLAHPFLELDAQLAQSITRIDIDIYHVDALQTSINALLAGLPPDIWVYYCYNSEYLYFPFAETRSIRDLLTFHSEERRAAMQCYVLDLYTADLTAHPNGVSLSDAHLDKSGYYSVPRKDPSNNWSDKDRQVNVFGGLKWRFANHVPPERRHIDRISIFQNRDQIKLRSDYTLSQEEANTYACPWHHNLTAAVLSFRTAKALMRNPAPRHEIKSFHWHNSVPFQWNSKQLLDMGMIEAGQWF